ncbi:LPS-assembly protein LptD [Phreatobacter sp. AB_2022a]|uniref:LPS-assembly protein LptD n=1 Tax=Phreatobacter sp. AB_2022a TaxID=3003134 RepID=UPI00228745F2|nr:LPS assembly protein LptD [Phreatobacter sp. AB_2022a]MCZ0734057.1 LPS assembly protein LptD [Phreatobacter sp. AB_2022a]
MRHAPSQRPVVSTRIARSAIHVSVSVLALIVAWGGCAPLRAQEQSPAEQRFVVPDPTRVDGSNYSAGSTATASGSNTVGAALPSPAPTFTQTSRNAQMQVNANQLVYDERTDRVSARGRVQIYYDGRTIEADQVSYDRRTNRMRATGNVRITEPSGIIAHAQDLELDQDFRDGFVRSLNIETPDRRYIGAANVTREGGDVTTFERATYTACDVCRDDRSRPPSWQIKSKRLIHRESERTIYFHDSRVELFGMPIAYIPYMSSPDPSVRKATGFLMPNIGGSSRTGPGIEIPYFWNIAPNYDLLFSPRYYQRQGFMPLAEWRHGFESGGYIIRGAGIFQQQPGVFSYADGTPEVGNRNFRGFISTSGSFRLTERWSFGWDLNLMSDTAFLRDYSLALPNQTEANSRVWLRGQGERSWFDLSATRYVGITAVDVDNKVLPTTHPVLDYFRVLDQGVFGGEFSWRTNVTSLTREAADLSIRDPLTPITCFSALPKAGANMLLPSNCLVNGIDGTYTRASLEVAWRRRIIDALGQVWEPFMSVRGDVAAYQLRDGGQVLGSFNNLVAGSGQTQTRFMPMVGMTYRYPFISANQFGTTTIEPIVQVIVRPSETLIGRLPNEDSQSLVFDDSSLFSTNKFSGWDRIEGGGRVNYGLNITHRFINGSFVNVLFGQSVSIFGLNSFAFGAPDIPGNPLYGTSGAYTGIPVGVYDIAGTGANSGLDKPRSDYVGSITYQMNRDFRFRASGRFDERTLAVQRGELEATGRFGNFALTGTYAYLAAQPLLGYQVPRSSIGAALSYTVAENWTVYAAARFAFERQNVLASYTNSTPLTERNKVEGLTLGVNYLDESMQFGFFYARDFAAAFLTNAGALETRDVHRFMFRFNVRTIGDFTISQNVSNWFNPPAQ